MSQHTPEPWYLYELSHVIHTRDGNGKAHGLARVYGGDKLANARRIVACVNRLASFSTKDIEDPAIDLTGANHWINRATRAEQQLVRANFQRDELLAALKEARNDVARVESGKFCDLRETLREVDAAIAKAGASL